MTSELRGHYRSACRFRPGSSLCGLRAAAQQRRACAHVDGRRAAWHEPWRTGREQPLARSTNVAPALPADGDGTNAAPTLGSAQGDLPQPKSSTASTTATAASFTQAPAAAPPAASNAQPPQPPQPRPQPPRGRATMEEMQREARARLGDIVRQQLEADRQPRPPPLPPPPLAGPIPSRDSSNIDLSAAAAASAALATATSEGADSASPTVGAPPVRAAASEVPEPGLRGVAKATTTAAEPSSEWDAMRREWDEDWQRVKDRWRQFVEHPLDPPPPRYPRQSGASGAAAGDTAAAAASDGEVQRVAVVSRLLQLACVAAFVAQWAPVAQTLWGGTAAVGGGGTPAGQVVLALLVACPPTPLTLSWQADAVSLSVGQLGCLLSSALLHSGLLPLGVSLASLEETLPWLETLDGFMIMLLSYGMAGAAAGVAQLCIGGQTAGIAGLGAAVGLEAAVAVRCWRYTGGQALPPSPACWALLAVAAVMAAYQPLIGPWGILGGVLGGVLSAVLAYDILYGIRTVVALTILLFIAAWKLLTWLPRAVWRLLVFLTAFIWATLVAVVQALRGV